MGLSRENPWHRGAKPFLIFEIFIDICIQYFENTQITLENKSRYRLKCQGLLYLQKCDVLTGYSARHKMLNSSHAVSKLRFVLSGVHTGRKVNLDAKR